ncbi:MAG: nucleotidyltransferase domain-containing protein [Vitreoscilla sp.]|nr:nucleotidyltransferase domain-containing protein [Polaromonas sp.]
MSFTSLSTAAQTAYSSITSASRLEDLRTVAELPGSFSKKIVKGREYWYYQTADLTGKQIQIFVGLASDELTELIAMHRAGGDKTVHLRQLARQAIAAGCPSIVPAHAKVLERLSDAGFFRAGGILVGTHVYMAYQNYLGIRWDSAAQTLDLDQNRNFSHAGRNVSVAIPSGVTMDMGTEIEALKMGFVPVKSLTTYVKSDERDLQIDFVTCMHRGGDTPVLIKALNATMQPLKFMEFSMEAPIQIALLAQRGAITVNAPPPEKYALHKLLVYGERPQNMRIKASKDLAQAASLIDYLGKNDAELLAETWVGLIGRGPGWRSRAIEGLTALRMYHPSADTSALIV